MTDKISFSHIGWAVKSIDDAVPAMSILGFEPIGDICIDTARKVKLLLLSDACSNTVELVAPMAEDSPVSEILQKNGPTPYHVCFSLEGKDFNEYKRDFISQGFAVLHKPAPAPLLGGKDVVFLYSKHIGLVELVMETPACHKGVVSVGK